MRVSHLAFTFFETRFTIFTQIDTINENSFLLTAVVKESKEAQAVVAFELTSSE